MYRARHLDETPESHIRGNEEIESEKKIKRNERRSDLICTVYCI